MGAEMTNLVERLRDSSARHDQEADLLCHRAADEIERLNAELAECRKDAERYRWLRDNIYYSHSDDCLEIEAEIRCHPSPNKADIDIAIDRAMQEAKP